MSDARARSMGLDVQHDAYAAGQRAFDVGTGGTEEWNIVPAELACRLRREGGMKVASECEDGADEVIRCERVALKHQLQELAGRVEDRRGRIDLDRRRTANGAHPLPF